MSPTLRGALRKPHTDFDPDSDLARKVMAALLGQPLWITRTVESVSLVDRHTVRRRISRHYEIPEKRMRPRLKGTDLIRLPVFAIPKGQFLSCDLIDENKRYVSLPPLPARAQLSAAVLLQLAEEEQGELDQSVAAKIRGFVTAGPETCRERLRAAKNDLALVPLFENAHFKYLATYFANNYVVYIDVHDGTDKDPVRRVIRFELDVRFPHKHRELEDLRELAKRRPGYKSVSWTPAPTGINKWVPWPIRVMLRRLGLMSHPYHHFVPVDGAGSLHLDVEAAEGIAFAKRKLRFRDPSGVVRQREAPGASSRRARFLIPRVSGRGSAAMTIYIRPAPGLLRNGAPILLLAFAALLWMSSCYYADLVRESAAVSLIFLIPGLVSVVAARSNEHPYVTSVLGVPRIFAIMPIPLGVIAAFVLIVEGSAGILEVEALAAASCGAILLLGRMIDETKIRPGLTEYVEDDLTRIG
jgi:hypothetical protein